jgi:hypothetical protein
MATFNKFQPFVEHLAEKVHNLGSDALKVALTNTLPTAANGVLADITQIAASGGYTAGGAAATVVTSVQTAGVYKLVLADVVFTATGAMGPFRAAVLYNSTAAAGNLIGWWDYGSSLTLNSGETFTVDYDPTTGVLTIT